MDLAETALLDQATSTEDASDLSQSMIGCEFDCYTIEAFLGKGGMASVFRAMHKSLYRPCAIKVLSPSRRNEGADLVQSFLAEARSAASVVHPHIVTVHNIGDSGSFPYIELEYVSGPSLQQMVQTEGQLDPYQSTEILVQACSALAEAHRCGLVHRDFKPSNILVTKTGLAKLSDFGLAKRVSAGAARTETLAGTPYFMAPELFSGTYAGKRSDVYAVGVSYYYLLTGQFPFVARSVPELARKHTSEPIPDPREACPRLPAEAVELLTRCMAKERDQRPADGAELQRELKAILRAMRSIRSLVDEAVKGLDFQCNYDESRVSIRVPLPGDRWQWVYVEDCTAKLAGERVVKVYSICCPAQDKYFRDALELNATVSYGSLAIDDVQGKPCFVMVNTYPRATCDPGEVRRSVLDVAHWADEVERLLTGQDRY
jgi:serine/threonine-protein kinase